VNGLQEEWGEQVLILQVNVNHKESRSLVEEFGGQFTPTFVLFDATGQEVWRATGRLDPSEARLQAGALVNKISEARWWANPLMNQFSEAHW
jgi:thioredoxin-related protein